MSICPWHPTSLRPSAVSVHYDSYVRRNLHIFINHIFPHYSAGSEHSSSLLGRFGAQLLTAAMLVNVPFVQARWNLSSLFAQKGTPQQKTLLAPLCFLYHMTNLQCHDLFRLIFDHLIDIFSIFICDLLKFILKLLDLIFRDLGLRKLL